MALFQNPYIPARRAPALNALSCPIESQSHSAKRDDQVHYPGERGQKAQDHAAEDEKVKSAQARRKALEAKFRRGVRRGENCPSSDTA